MNSTAGRSGSVIALFTRIPVAGQVKTRLIPALGAEAACRIHEQLLEAVLELLHAQQLADVQVWVDSQAAHRLTDACGFPLHLQQGSDLGQRMAHAAQKLLTRYQNVILIGSDCPKLDADYLQSALQALQSGSDLVLGPATDGGYVLLGLKQAEASLFSGISWGSGQVLSQTLARAGALGLSYSLLPALPDIDQPEDLQYLAGSQEFNGLLSSS